MTLLKYSGATTLVEEIIIREDSEEGGNQMSNAESEHEVETITKPTLEGLRDRFKILQLQKKNHDLQTANSILQASLNDLQTSLNSLQREIFLLRNPNNSNFKTSFPTKEEIFSEYIDLVEQHAFNCACEFSSSWQVIRLCKAVEYTVNTAISQYSYIVGTASSAMYFPSHDAFVASKCYYEFTEHMKENYASVVEFGKWQRAEALKEIKEKQFSAFLGNILDRTFYLAWRIRLAGMHFQWFEGAGRFCKTLGNSTGKVILLFPPIYSGTQYVKHGYFLSV